MFSYENMYTAKLKNQINICKHFDMKEVMNIEK